jgi:AraC-like DNA-binding protein
MLKHSTINYDSLRHKFKRAFGQSPQRLLQMMRLERAKYLLLNSQLSIKEIAPQVGYARQHEFTRAFGRSLGVSPSEWRTQIQSA